MIIDWQKIPTMTAEEIENIKVEVFKEVQTMKQTKFILKEEYSELKKQKIIIEGEMHEIKTQMEKSGYNIGQKEADIELLENAFWKARKGY